MNITSPFSLSIVAITALSLARPADRPRHDRRLHPVSLACRSRHGHRGGTAAQRDVHQLHHPRCADVHPRRRTDEHRLDDGTAAQFLQRGGRSLPGRPCAGERAAVDHLRRHVRLGHRRRCRHRQDDADDDDCRRQVPGKLCRGAHSGDAVIGPIIPPSIPMVLFALVSDASIGYLFIAGIVSGPAHGVRPDGHRRPRRAQKEFPRREGDPGSRTARADLARAAGAHAARHPARRHPRRRDDAD